MAVGAIVRWLMWCPNCWQKFRWYLTVCPECRVELVDERPGPPPEPDVELLRVFVTVNEELTAVVKSLFDAEGILHMVRFEGLQDLFGWGRLFTGYNFIVGPVEFWVRADDAERARACLVGLGALPTEGMEASDDA